MIEHKGKLYADKLSETDLRKCREYLKALVWKKIGEFWGISEHPNRGGTLE